MHKPSCVAEDGFTLIELLIAVALTVIIMGSVFGLLTVGQDSFRREHEVADMLMSTRSGIQMMDRDLSMAGYRTPPASTILWSDGGGIQPDEVTIVYADPNIALARPLQCGTAGAGGGGGACGTIGQSATLYLEADSLDPSPPNPTDAYDQGMVLMAIETQDCNGDGQVGMYPFHVTQDPIMTSANGVDTLNVNHNPGTLASDLNPPGGFNGEVREDCAVVGRFHMVTYRVSPPPPVGNPTLERRDLVEGTDWVSVAYNIENLQVSYGIGQDVNLVDVPTLVPSDDPLTWIHRVAFTVTGRSESANLKGGSQGVFDPADTYVRKSISSQVALRNVVAAASNRIAMVP
jgi:prepilin-type N-terminal cleavage/methylation domain-containing protein